jgi:hypothetical protein
MFAEGQFTNLICTLYGAPTAPELWNEFLAELAKITKTNKIGLLSHNLAHDTHTVVGRTGEGGVRMPKESTKRSMASTTNGICEAAI